MPSWCLKKKSEEHPEFFFLGIIVIRIFRMFDSLSKEEEKTKNGGRAVRKWSIQFYLLKNKGGFGPIVFISVVYFQIQFALSPFLAEK